MFTASARGPSLEELRPEKPTVGRDPQGDWTFPVHPKLVQTLVDHDPGRADARSEPDPTVAHSLAACAAYAYAEVAGFGDEPNTVARMMARLGMPENRTLMIAERNDAAFVASSGFLVQSEDGRVVILAYRGTEPFNVTSWMTDADLHNGPLPIEINGKCFEVHPGFYRNVRATRSPLIEALHLARNGRSVIDGSPVANPMQALHITGHSLGAAMSSLMALLLLNDPDYSELAGLTRSVYAFGQPMIGPESLAKEVEAFGQADRFLRFVYRNDVVPKLPPRGLGDYAHFGPEYVVAHDGYRLARRSTGQAPFCALAAAPVAFIAQRLPILHLLPVPYSLDNHLPLNYVTWLTPPGTSTEYGDYPPGAPT